MGQRGGTDSLKARALGFRWLYGWGCREALVSGRPGELLNNIPEIILIDVVNRRLMLLLLLLLQTLLLWLRLRLRLRLRLWLWRWVVILMVIGMINSRSSDDGFRDLVRNFIEVFEVVISAAATSATAGISSDGRVTRGMTAFIHYFHLSISLYL